MGAGIRAGSGDSPWCGRVRLLGVRVLQGLGMSAFKDVAKELTTKCQLCAREASAVNRTQVIPCLTELSV